MSTNTMQTDETQDSFDKQGLIETFESHRNLDESEDEDVLLMESAHVIAVVFDWDEWEDSEGVEPEDFTEQATMVTGRSMGEVDTFLFSSGGNRAFFTEDYIEMANELVGFNAKANLDRVRLFDIEDGPMLIEGDGFDVILAPRLPPDDW